MWTATKNEKCCATCANWGGGRSVTYAHTVETDDPGEYGKCYAGVFSGCSSGQRACDGRNCAKYQKWSAL